MPVSWFDCPGSDRRSDSVRAFQRLWNTNNPCARGSRRGAKAPSITRAPRRGQRRRFPAARAVCSHRPVRAALALSLVLLSAGASAQTVSSVAAQRRCSTAGVEGVSRQLVDTQICMFPGVFVNVTPRAGISVSESRLFTLAQREAALAVVAASPSCCSSPR